MILVQLPYKKYIAARKVKPYKPKYFAVNRANNSE